MPRRDIELLGDALTWHGGLTLDYLHRRGQPSYIECNPRTVEPGNAAASGVNLPQLQLGLTNGAQPGSPPRIGASGVRTHGTIVLVLGAAAHGSGRRSVIAESGRALARRGSYRASAEQLSPRSGETP
jgi:hypothetical protein